MKKILLFLVVTLGFLFGQRNPSPLLIETNVVYGSQEPVAYISFKLPLKYLFFVKDSDSYQAGINFSVEIQNAEEESTTKRENYYTKFITEKYSDTEESSKFVEGLVSIKITPGEYQVTPIVELENTTRSFKLRPVELLVLDESPEMEYFLVDELSDKEFKLANSRGNIPYSLNRTSLYLATKSGYDAIKVKLIQEDAVFNEQEIKREFEGNYSFVAKSNEVFAEIINSGSNSFFRLEDVGKQLKEGEVVVEVTSENSTDSLFLDVEWTNRPRSLNNPKFAIELLEVIYDKDVVRKLLKYDDDEYYTELQKFWTSKDPVPATGFNELMYEFYKRSDYAIDKFGTASNGNGSKTDRGEIFIKYGKPDNVKRYYNDKREAVELWLYKKMNTEFIFIDSSGLGDYKLKD